MKQFCIDILKKYNCKAYINTNEELQQVFSTYKNIYFCSGCSKTKTLKNGIPKDFYISKRLLNFYIYCEKEKFNYGILSDKYGIHFMNEVLKYYDIHPSQLNNKNFKILGEKINKKCRKRNIDCLIYYNPSPLLGVPYFKMLNYSNIDFFYITKRISLKTQNLF